MTVNCILPRGCRDPLDCTGRCVAANLEDTRRIFAELGRKEANGYPLCEHTADMPGCVPCSYRRWFNALGVTFTSHNIPYKAFCAGYAARSMQ